MPWRTPAAAHSRIASSRPSAGIARTTRSGGAGSSARLGWQGRPATVPPLRLIGHTGPGKRNFMSRRIVSPPRLPGRSEAPITAIEAGDRMPETSRNPCWPESMSVCSLSRRRCDPDRGIAIDHLGAVLVLAPDVELQDRSAIVAALDREHAAAHENRGAEKHGLDELG